MSCDCWCSVSLPHGAMGCSTVFDCGISPGHTHLLFDDIVNIRFKPLKRQEKIASENTVS